MRSEWILRENSHDYCLKALSLENFLMSVEKCAARGVGIV